MWGFVCTVNQAAKNNKCGRPGKKLDLARVLELVKSGKKDQEMAEEMGVSVRKVRSFRKEYGIAPVVGHGGARRGVGRKKFSAGPNDAYMMRQQAIDARVNSIDAGLRMGKLGMYESHWLKWAGSAFEYNKDQKQYVSKLQGFGIPGTIKGSMASA